MKHMQRAGALLLALCLCLLALPLSATASGDFELSGGILTKYNGSGGHVVIPDGVSYIANQAFSGCQNLTSVAIPDSVTGIGQEAFYHCANLTSVTMGTRVSSIGSFAFAGCSSLADIVLSESLTSLGTSAFLSCSSLTRITLPARLQSIGSSCFSYSGLTAIAIPEGISTLESSTFRHCEQLAQVTLPSRLKSIRAQAFDSCHALTELELPDGLTTLGKYAFSDSGLEQLRIPASVSDFGDAVFRGCDGLMLYVAEHSEGQLYAAEQHLAFTLSGESVSPIYASASAWAQEEIAAALDYGLVPKPLRAQFTQPTTRSEFAALVVRLYETVTEQEISARVSFLDTRDIAVEKAAGIGVVKGVGDRLFQPDAPLTREQAAVMLARLADALEASLPQEAASFSDLDAVSSWARSAVGQVQASQLMRGIGGNQFAPQAPYAREQSIVTILRLYERLQAAPAERALLEFSEDLQPNT